MKKGQKVVCIKEGEWEHFSGNRRPFTPPKCDEIYKVIGVDNDPGFESGLGLILEEYGKYFAFDSSNFRHVDESFGEKTAERLEKKFDFQEVSVAQLIREIFEICRK